MQDPEDPEAEEKALAEHLERVGTFVDLGHDANVRELGPPKNAADKATDELFEHFGPLALPGTSH